MDHLTEEEKQKRDQDWIKKIGTLEYNTFNLCKSSVDGYESRLNDYERSIEQEELFYSWVGYEHDRQSLLYAKINLQNLLGYDPSFRNQPKLKTLEEALREVELEEAEIKIETENCQKYDQKAHDLQERCSYLSEQVLELQKRVLTAKMRSGETLTERERKALEFIYDVADANH
ncbi:MAG: hypothetical protein Q8Q01_02690 [archaeon]|nr:hypothetical protein [archaeon]